MKKSILFLIGIFAYTSGIFGQNNITFNVHHKLADADFAFEQGAKNNMDHDFNVTRLQYYIDGVSIIHDGGTETTIADTYILVDASAPTQVDLGSHDINEVEAIHFHIGVNEEVNHEDPSSYPSGHALAPVFPSMHWGWAAGYRFVAIEGYGSAQYNQLYQLHGLGDANYFKVEVPLTAEADNGTIAIDVNADYTRVLEDIPVNDGVIVHGAFGAAKTALENFRDFVFSPTNGATSTVDFSEITQFDIYPNPSPDGFATVSVASSSDLNYDLSVTDLLGRSVQYFEKITGNGTQSIQVEQPGIYMVNLIKNGQVVLTQKLVK